MVRIVLTCEKAALYLNSSGKKQLNKTRIRKTIKKCSNYCANGECSPVRFVSASML